MSSATYNLEIEKGVDFSFSAVLQRANGDFIDLTDTGVCVKAQIVEFLGMPPLTGFDITEVPPSGVTLSLSEEATSLLPSFGKSYYDLVLNVSGESERMLEGEITATQNATRDILCP